MAASTFLTIGGVGLVLLIISAFFGGDDADIDTDVDVDFDVDADVEVDASTGSGIGVLDWFSVKGLSMAAVGFGFIGWATTSNGATALTVWILSSVVGLALWAVAVVALFPWLKRQQGHDLESHGAYVGLSAEVVVRIPPNGVGTVQFTDTHGLVVRRDARSNHADADLPVGGSVLVVLSDADHLVVEEHPFLKD